MAVEQSLRDYGLGFHLEGIEGQEHRAVAVRAFLGNLASQHVEAYDASDHAKRVAEWQKERSEQLDQVLSIVHATQEAA